MKPHKERLGQNWLLAVAGTNLRRLSTGVKYIVSSVSEPKLGTR